MCLRVMRRFGRVSLHAVGCIRPAPMASEDVAAAMTPEAVAACAGREHESMNSKGVDQTLIDSCVAHATMQLFKATKSHMLTHPLATGLNPQHAGEEEGELGEEEGEEEEEAAEDGADGLTQEQRAQLQMQQMLRAMGMAR